MFSFLQVTTFDIFKYVNPFNCTIYRAKLDESLYKLLLMFRNVYKTLSNRQMKERTRRRKLRKVQKLVSYGITDAKEAQCVLQTVKSPRKRALQR